VNRMDVGQLEARLHEEGFRHTYVWEDPSEVFYQDHRHPTLTAHIILSGEMKLTVSGESNTYYPGERCDVPAGAVHSARVGPRGCRYLIGEK
jgi:mannose-6-phosphate isomerase-like protein (cupin superfamily)